MNDALVDAINKECARVLDDGDKDGIMANADHLTKQCIDDGCAYVDYFNIHRTGFHPDNRFTTGLLATGVWRVIQETAPRGWSDYKVELARAFEVANGPKGDGQRKTNVETAVSSDNMLPAIDPDNLWILGVGCTHTGASLRCIDKCAMPPAEDEFWENLKQPDGRLSKEMFLEKYPSYKAPLERGMKWTVFRKIVEEKCPRFPAYLQEAGNTEHGTEQRVSILALCFEAHRRGSQLDKGSGAPWDVISKELETNRAFIKGQGSAICKFVSTWSGGRNPTYLKEIDEWSKTLPVKRELDPKQLNLLSTASIVSLPEWITACVKTLLIAPRNFIRRGIAGDEVTAMFEDADIKNMADKHRELICIHEL